MKIEEIFVTLGEFGRFQRWLFFAVCFSSFSAGAQMVLNIFSGAKPTDDEKFCKSNTNLTACDDLCETIGYNDSFISYATEWRMVCGSAATKVDSTTSIYMFGLMIGSCIMGCLADKFGRFPILVIAQFLSSIFALAASFSQSWSVYVALRFISGFGISGQAVVGTVLQYELMGPNIRGIVSTIPSVAFSFGICLLSATAYLTLNWRTMSIILGLLGVMCTIITYVFFTESPHWCLAKGNIRKCKLILRRIAKTNGCDLGDFEIDLPTDVGLNDTKKQPCSIGLLTDTAVIKITLIQMLSWFTNSAVYYGLTLAAGHLGKSRYLSVVLSAITEIPSNLIILYLVDHPRVGRVRSCAISMLLASVCCGVIWFINDEHYAAIIALACGGKFFICMSFDVIYLQAAELYPSSIRNVGLGIISVFNRIGGVSAPFFVILDHKSHNSHFFAFGVLGMVSGLFCFALPETLNTLLPNSANEIFNRIPAPRKTPIQQAEDGQALLSSNASQYEE